MEQVAALKRRRAYIIAKLYNIGESIRATEKKVFGKQGPPEVCTFLLEPSRRNIEHPRKDNSIYSPREGGGT